LTRFRIVSIVTITFELRGRGEVGYRTGLSSRGSRVQVPSLPIQPRITGVFYFYEKIPAAAGRSYGGFIR
jgi:hypothetical protein